LRFFKNSLTRRGRAVELLWLTLGASLMALGIYFFEILNHFTTGGISGLSIILSAVFPKIGAADLLFVINLALLLLGFLVLGKGFGLKTAYCSTLVSVETVLLEHFFARTAPLTDQPMLEAAFMVLLPALGGAIIFYFGGSSGGTDIIAMILKRRFTLSISRALFISDLFIVMLSSFVFGIEIWLFSLLGFLLRVLLVDRILDTINTSKFCTLVISPDCLDALCRFITNDLKKSATVSNAFEGAYGRQKKSVLLVALTRRQAMRLKHFARTLDEKAFMIVTQTSEIMGEGFLDAF
jgi:uncharacterized membrane-anchored protein YitT (DUF2179 family)